MQLPFGKPTNMTKPEADNSGAAIVAQTQNAPQVIGKEQVQKLNTVLSEYKSGKSSLEARIVEDENWYKLRHWDAIKANGATTQRPEPASGWLFNSIMNKHADAMDNYPTPNVLPRERSDEQDAETLSSIIPVILEHAEFDSTYSYAWWEKLKHGTAAYGVFWNNDLEHGIGDIDIKAIDLLNIFWEPGQSDLQKSRYLFVVDLVDTDLLEQKYPQYKGQLGGQTIDVAEYQHDDNVDTTGKSVVVDCYYKIKTPGGRTNLHMVKFVNDLLLFASENEPDKYGEKGFYDHGQFPIVFDTLFPAKGTPVGFGLVAIGKDTQMYIDKLSQNVLESSIMAAKPRFWAAQNTGINVDQFKDWSQPIVEVESGNIDDAKIRQIDISPAPGICLDVMTLKIDELKEVTANRDVNSGSGSGVTAAAAIAALQEAGNKSSRDMIAASYRAYTEIIYLVIELIREFYTEQRTFRITNTMPGQKGYDFVDYSSQNIQEQQLPPMYDGQAPAYRVPIFDIKIAAEKKNPFSQMAMNETAKELYRLGVFNPEQATPALAMLEMMNFEGIEKVKDKVQEGDTLLKTVQQLLAQMQQMMAVVQATSGQDMGVHPQGAQPQSTGGGTAPQTSGGGQSVNSEAAQAQGKTQMTGYGQRLAQNARPNMSATADAAAPGR